MQAALSVAAVHSPQAQLMAHAHIGSRHITEQNPKPPQGLTAHAQPPGRRKLATAAGPARDRGDDGASETPDAATASQAAATSASLSASRSGSGPHSVTPLSFFL